MKKALYFFEFKLFLSALIVCVSLHKAATQNQVTLSFQNPVTVSSTVIEFDVMIRRSGTNALKLNGANVHTLYSPAGNVPASPSPTYTFASTANIFNLPSMTAAFNTTSPQMRQTSGTLGNFNTAADIPTSAEFFFRGRLTVPGGITFPLDVNFKGAGSAPNISINVYVPAGTTTSLTIANGGVVIEAGVTFSSPLPVELEELAAAPRESTNIVTWSTASELNSQYHIVERSADGIDNWKEIGRKAAAGTTQERQLYNLVDEHPLPTSYYRLKMQDFDGKFEYSKVVNVERRSNDFGVMNVFPTPTEGRVTFQVKLPEFSNLIVSVTDVNGRLLQILDIEREQGISDIQLDLTKYAAGIYYVNINNGSEQLTEEVVKY